nr:MAG TPA: hypothetical protein [Microviridae sp.]
MKLRKPNKNNPIINDQSDDKVVVDGFMTPGEIVERGKLAAQNTIETMKVMYPHSPEMRLREEEYIANEELNRALRELENQNKEGISAFYSKHKIKEKIKNINEDIKRLDQQYQETRRTNLLYQKENRIKELENIIKDLKNK